MTPNWDALFSALPPEELDKVALLRMIECTNGVSSTNSEMVQMML